MYLTYAEYTTKGGTLDSTTFGRLEFRAEMIINHATFGRAKELSPIPDEVKNLVFELVDVGDQDVKNLSSVSNDGYSESYAKVNNEERALVLVNAYLAQVKTADGTPVLYRGVRE